MSSTDPTASPSTAGDITGAREPVRYTGELQPSPAYFDGALPHAVGVHHIQVFRATRSGAAGGVGFTYNHQPYVVWWRGQFHVQYLSAPRSEHEAPTVTFLCSSPDGYHWSPPRLAFPEYRLPALQLGGVAYPAGLAAVMHQRMGFYVAPNDRLLVVGFYGVCPDSTHSPNAGNGVGRVVRELRADDSLGDIFFIRYNRHAGFDEHNTTFPFYTQSADPGFRAACESLLQDKLATLQWWEEDRGRDGFFPLVPSAVPDAADFHAGIVTSKGAGKAFTWYTRSDGVVVGLWKNQYSALSPDRGQTWTPIVRNRTLRTTGAKTWGQRTSDGKFAIVYNHSATQANRFPIAALVGANGREFGTLLCLGGEVAPRRYWGEHKGVGMHYFRGVSEGSPPPPDGALWVAYSMNKEDIWILRASVPLSAAETIAPSPDEIECAQTVADLTRWNLYLPQWAAARMTADPVTGKRVLELRDEDPSDYAWAERVFPAASKVRVRFRIQARAFRDGGFCDIELQTQRHERPIRLRVMRDALQCEGGAPVHSTLERWQLIEVVCDCPARRFSVAVDSRVVCADVPLAEPVLVIERIVFRTGAWRGRVPARLIDGKLAGQEARVLGTDVEADDRLRPTIFWIGEFSVAPA